MPSRVERAVLRFVVQCIEEEGSAPSVRVLQRHLGHKSPSTTHFIVKQMVARGWLELSGKSRAIMPTQAGLEGVGRV